MKKEENFLDYIPKRNQRYVYHINEKGMVEIAVPNRGICNRILQVLCKKPKITYIELEQMGSFLWQQMDGEKSIYQLGLLEQEKFGKDTEPLFERLCTYVQTLRKMGFIVYVNQK